MYLQLTLNLNIGRAQSMSSDDIIDLSKESYCVDSLEVDSFMDNLESFMLSICHQFSSNIKLQNQSFELDTSNHSIIVSFNSSNLDMRTLEELSCILKRAKDLAPIIVTSDKDDYLINFSNSYLTYA